MENWSRTVVSWRDLRSRIASQDWRAISVSRVCGGERDGKGGGGREGRGGDGKGGEGRGGERKEKSTIKCNKITLAPAHSEYICGKQ